MRHTNNTQTTHTPDRLEQMDKAADLRKVALAAVLFALGGVIMGLLFWNMYLDSTACLDQF